MATIIDVAKKAGVGIATVSRVINKSGYVKQETREKIERVINEIGYVSNEIARSMTLQRNNIVAFVLPDCLHFFFGELLYHVEQELYQKGYKLMVCNSSEQLEKEIVYIDMLKTNRVDAIILLTNNDIEPYLDKSFPIVSFDRKFTDVPFVASDNYMGGVTAAHHLIEKGCRHFMFIGDDAQGDNTPVQTEVSKRRLGYLDELRRNGIEEVIKIEYPLGNYLYLPDYVHQIIADHPEVDGIFAISDAVAAEVIFNIEKGGRKVPDDVKVIGYDGGRSYFKLGKRITSISQSPDLIAQAIVSIILKLVNEETSESIITPITINLGETT